MKKKIIYPVFYLKNGLVKDKIVCIVLGIILSFIVMELFLRLLGFSYNLVYKIPGDEAADYKIFCVGESTTFGIGASNPVLKGYPHLLEEKLNRKFPDINIKCFFEQNIGWNTTENLLKITFYLEKYRPNLVIFMVGANNGWSLNKSNILLFNKSKIISGLTLKIAVFLDRFRVWKLLRWIGYSTGLIKINSNFYFPHFEDGKELAIHVARYTDSLRKKYRYNIFLEIAEYDLRKMVGICNNFKIKVIICSYPVEDYLGPIQEKVAKEFNVPFVDNSLFFQKATNFNSYFYSDGWHPNDKGYELLAENIYKCILENKLIR